MTPPRPPDTDADADAARLAALIGEPAPWARRLLAALGRVGLRGWRRDVEPILARRAPDLDQRVVAKLRFLACRTYAAGVYTTLLASPRGPLALRPLAALSRLPGVRPEHLARAAELALPALGRVVLRDACRRVTLVGAFVAAIDHALDHPDPPDVSGAPGDHRRDDPAPAARGARFHALLRGALGTPPGLLGVVRELQLAMESGLGPVARARYEPAIARCHDWIDAEVALVSGAPDPEGLGHRRAGVEGVIDGLAFPLGARVDDGARRWMYAASMFIQVMDDWLDRDRDRAEGRPTPAVTGAWTFADVARRWRETHAGVAALARAAGFDAPALAALGQETYRAAIHDVMRAMVTGEAA